MKQSDEPIADITLLLEGTYPYVRGGVSSWVHQIIKGLPEFSFGLVFIGASEDSYQDVQYELPGNVLFLQCHYLQDALRPEKPKAREGNPEAFETMAELHVELKKKRGALSCELLRDALKLVGSSSGISHQDFLYSECSWERIEQGYKNYCEDPSFLDYFWAIRSMHAPIFLLADIARSIPKTRCFHSVSTGYAGYLGATVKQLRPDIPYIITEHGIYTKERKIDLAQAQWIKDRSQDQGFSSMADFGYLRKMWISFFEMLGRITYEAADQILSIYEGNRLRQIQDGADVAKTRVIPNGITLNTSQTALPEPPEQIPQVVGLIGRVVPIKDIKTFIRTIHSLRRQQPGVEGWIIGPDEEDPEYVASCRALVKELELESCVKFLGFQKVSDILPKLGVMLLTSISEAQPLVILEAYAAGVPCVSTDVGSCRELIEGALDEQDVALGSAGEVVDIADPQAAARACAHLLNDRNYWLEARQAGFNRTCLYYTEELLFQRYRDLYSTVISTDTNIEHLSLKQQEEVTD